MVTEISNLETKYRKALAVIRWLVGYRKAVKATQTRCHKALAVIRWLVGYRKAVKAARMSLDYDLRDLPMPEKTCDQRIWQANMNAHKMLAADRERVKPWNPSS